MVVTVVVPSGGAWPLTLDSVKLHWACLVGSSSGRTHAVQVKLYSCAARKI